MMHHGYSNNLIFSRRAEERLSRMMAFSLSFHLFLIMTIVIVSIISDKKLHRFDASYVTLVTVPEEDVSNQSESRPSVPGGMEREKKNKVERERERERERSIISRKEISGKDSAVDTKQKEGLNDWWKKNKESLIASNDTKTQCKLTVPPPATIPKAQEKPSSIEQ
ncbi:MAG: hypothetical protein HZA13_03980, partial [Nitrospirae bacterium]|nr:hypothetical protein [Nitrospirota bacterium]